MKIHFTMIDDDGNQYEGGAELVRVAKKSKSSTVASASRTTKASFSLNPRAFMNKYAKGKSGSRKFTLLLAHLAQGKVGQEVAGKQLVADWNRMKGVLGGAFNRAHATRAKEEGWIDSPRFGYYSLSSSWQEAVSD